jgi:hypothetical protein
LLAQRHFFFRGRPSRQYYHDLYRRKERLLPRSTKTLLSFRITSCPVVASEPSGQLDCDYTEQDPNHSEATLADTAGTLLEKRKIEYRFEQSTAYRRFPLSKIRQLRSVPAQLVVLGTARTDPGIMNAPAELDYTSLEYATSLSA